MRKFICLSALFLLTISSTFINAQDVLYPTTYKLKDNVLANTLLDKAYVTNIYIDSSGNVQAVFKDLGFMEEFNKRNANSLAVVECNGKHSIRKHSVVKVKHIRPQLREQYKSKLLELTYKDAIDLLKDEVKEVCRSNRVDMVQGIDYQFEYTDIQSIKSNVGQKSTEILNKLLTIYPDIEIGPYIKNKYDNLFKLIPIEYVSNLNDFEMFLTNKSGFSLNEMMKNWVLNLGEAGEMKEKHSLGIEFIIKKSFFSFKKPYCRIELDTINGEIPDVLPHFETDNCQTLNQMNYILDRLRDSVKFPGLHSDYIFDVEEKHTKPFVIYYMNGGNRGDKREIELLKKFLRDTSNMVYSVSVCGYSSVNGDSAQNARLQNARTKQLSDIIEPFVADTVVVNEKATENWELFGKQIKMYENMEYFRGKSKAEVKEILKNNYWSTKTQPVLTMQRYARAEIDTRKILSPDEIISKAVEEIKAQTDSIYTTVNDSIDLKLHNERINLLLSISERAEKEILHKRTSRSLFENTISYDQFPEFYINQYLAASDSIYHTDSLPEAFGNIDSLCNNAYLASIQLLRKYNGTPNSQYYYNIAAFVQANNYNLINQGLVDPEMFCQWNYYYNEFRQTKNSFSRNDGNNNIIEKISCVSRDTSEVSEEEAKLGRRFSYNKYKEYVSNYMKTKQKVITHEFWLFNFIRTWTENWDIQAESFIDNEFTVEQINQLANELVNQHITLCSITMWETLFDLYSKSAIYYSSPANYSSEGLASVLQSINSYYFAHRATQVEDMTMIAGLNANFGQYLKNDKSVLNDFKEKWLELMKKEKTKDRNVWKQFLNFCQMTSEDKAKDFETTKEQTGEELYKTFYTGKYNIRHNKFAD